MRPSPIHPAILGCGHIFSIIPLCRLTLSPHLPPYLCLFIQGYSATALGPNITQNALLFTAMVLLQIRACSESGWTQTFGDRNQCNTEQVSDVWVPDSSLLSKPNHTLSLRRCEIGCILKPGLMRTTVTGNQRNFENI